MIDLENTSFDHCIKCTVCTAYCPVARVSSRYPGPKASGPDCERLRVKNPKLIDDTLGLCTNCKRCEIACPSDVKIADIIHTAKHKYAKKKFNARNFLLSHTDMMGSVGTVFAPLVNVSTKNPAVKTGMDRVLGIPKSRTMPEYAWGTFRTKLKLQARTQARFDRRVLYYTGCYVNYNDHELGFDLVKVLNAMGYGVAATREKCCGVPLIANGFLEKARKNARHNVKVLSRAAGKGDLPIVATSSSCTFALKNEYPHLLEVDNAAIDDRLYFITRFLVREMSAGNAPEMGPVNLRVAYHAPCHLERMGGALHTISLLQRIPGLELTLLHSECCGISGTYGFKKETTGIAQDVGADLFWRIGEARPDLVVTDCETCKWQIEMSTPYQVIHPVSLVARAMDKA